MSMNKLYGYRTRPQSVSAFKWGGKLNDIPSWAAQLCTGVTPNVATEPHGLIMHTLKWGDVKVRHGDWFVNDSAGVCYTRTDEAFVRMYELNT